MKALVGFALVGLIASTGFAQTVTFSEDEIRTHREKIDVVTSTASACLQATWDDHVEFFGQWKVSKYYGNRKPEHRTEELRREQLVKFGAPASLVKELEPISCIGLTVKCLGDGFAAAGQSQTWAKIHAKLAVNNNFYGTDLQTMLRDLGWTSMYWNPDPSQNAKWDEEDKRLNPLKPGKVWNPVWGGHAYRMALVKRKSDYYGIRIDDQMTLVDFKKTMPQAFKQHPFFVGTAHAGYHVFPGRHGEIIEAHSMRALNAFDNLEVSNFNPLATGGGPKWTSSEKYRSGVIVVPPTAQ
ncbi:MAG: hypothetical protein V4760_13770 [Bdellovibrionota bacterium]